VLLHPHEVHLWYAFVDRVTDAALLTRYQSVLSAQETSRHRRFLFEKDRRQFLISHTLLRTALSQYVDVPPAAWVFATNDHGKPQIAAPAGLPLCFNLSHTRGLAVVAVTRDRAVGVDAENLERADPGLDLAKRFFAAAEVEQLCCLEANQRKAAFFDFWTLKEAYIKARGLGLALPLDGFVFHLDDAGPPRITFTDKITDDSARWQFVQLRPASNFKIAVAVARSGDSDLTVVARLMVPRV
jgi:4'-phosphopantetheinyl transferase